MKNTSRWDTLSSSLPLTYTNPQSRCSTYPCTLSARKAVQRPRFVRCSMHLPNPLVVCLSMTLCLLDQPSIHPIDVLIRFCLHPVALTADVSKMYRAIELTQSDRDFHRFVWRKDPSESLRDYCMTRVTFGVSASSFAANLAVKQNAHDNIAEYPQAAETVEKSYVDDCLTGADTVTAAMELQKQLQELFNLGGLLLRKWNASEPAVLKNLPSDLKDPHVTQIFHDSVAEYTQRPWVWNGMRTRTSSALLLPSCLLSTTSSSDSSSLTSPRLSMFWDGFPHRPSKPRSFSNDCGSKEWTGTTQFPHLFEKHGYTGLQSSICSQRSLSHAATLTSPLTLPRSSPTVSVMLPSTPTLLQSTCA